MSRKLPVVVARQFAVCPYPEFAILILEHREDYSRKSVLNVMVVAGFQDREPTPVGDA
jgi:hypothetical protein